MKKPPSSGRLFFNEIKVLRYSENPIENQKNTFISVWKLFNVHAVLIQIFDWLILRWALATW